MDIENSKKNWDALGKDDPLWVILSRRDKKGNKWQLEEFFQTGRDEVAALIRTIEFFNLGFVRGKVLDFGCGVGRLTQALAQHFEEVTGVDISPSMLRLAKDCNNFGNRCKYLLNDTDDLGIFADECFDFIYTNITLQHIEPRFSKKYIKEFLRVLKPDGLLVFQLAESPSVKKRLNVLNEIRNLAKKVLPVPVILFYRWVKYHWKDSALPLTSAVPSGPVIEMHGIEHSRVIRFVEKNKGRIFGYMENKASGEGWISYVYFVGKKPVA